MASPHIYAYAFGVCIGIKNASSGAEFRILKVTNTSYCCAGGC